MEIEFEEEANESGLLYFIKKHKIKLIILTAVLVFLCYSCYSCYKLILPTDWYYFNAERIEFVENKYKISLDNAKPKRYWEPSMFPEDGDSHLSFKTDDYRRFMEDFHGKSVRSSYESDDGSFAEYSCRIDERLICNIKFERKGSKYEGIIDCYRFNESMETSTQPSNGLYFVTICTKNRVQYLSEIIDGNDDIVGNAALGVPIVKFTEYGEIVNKNIIKINEIYRYISVLNYVIMPDHIHLILFVSDYEDDTVTGGTPRAAFPTKSVSQIINGLKSISTKQIGFSIWQKNFHDHIIRNREELHQIWQYIDNNPINWASDIYNQNSWR